MDMQEVKRLAGVMPRYFGIWSSTGVHVGVWEDGCIAGKVLADEYPSGKIIEMVSVDDAGEYAAKLASASADIAALREAAAQHGYVLTPKMGNKTARADINAELLEALMDCLNFLDFDCGDMKSAGPERNKARAAIARATSRD